MISASRSGDDPDGDHERRIGAAQVRAVESKRVEVDGSIEPSLD